jgi:hypothetical protein
VRALSCGAGGVIWLCFATHVQAAENRPDYCAPVSDALLGGLAAPYARQVAPDGSVYCEGLLRNPIALQPPQVVSVKQDQAVNSGFAAGSVAALTWCDESRLPVHLQLRAMKPPLFALDALHTGKFEWRADLIATWQPDWNQVAALATRGAAVEGHTHEVVVPVRMGPGYSSHYSFVVRSNTMVHLTNALIEPVNAATKPEIVNIAAHSGPTKDTWVVAISLANRAAGLFRVTLEEGVDQAGVSTEPIYLLHGGCTGK